MKLQFVASVEVFDKDKYMKALKAEIRKCFMKAGQRFLLAAIPRVPVWTGMARGAFRNAEDLFGKVTNDAQSKSGVRIRTTRSAKQGRGGGSDDKGRRGWYYTPPGGSKIQRTPQAGRLFSTQPEGILERVGGVTLASGRDAFYFVYEINITYFTKFDEKWGAFKAGGQALEDYVRANLKLPDPLTFMTRKTYKV